MNNLHSLALGFYFSQAAVTPEWVINKEGTKGFVSRFGGSFPHLKFVVCFLFREYHFPTNGLETEKKRPSGFFVRSCTGMCSASFGYLDFRTLLQPSLTDFTPTFIPNLNIIKKPGLNFLLS